MSLKYVKSGYNMSRVNKMRSSYVLLCSFFLTDLVAQRGEKLELLIDKTENLVDSVSLNIVSHATFSPLVV